MEQLGSKYFLILVGGNFLFAMGATFAAFQSGIGETKVLTRAPLFANGANILLNYLLIFGVEGWIPPLGIRGAALGTVLSQGLHCLLLFRSFFKHKRREEFQMSHWRLSPKIFGKLFRLGAPSSARAAGNLFYWVIVVK